MRFILFAIFLLLSTPVFAQGIVQECGMPAPAELDTENVPNYCDYHNRRLSYHQEQKRFREQLQERQENYIAPQHEVYKDYNENLEALRKTMATDGNTGNE